MINVSTKKVRNPPSISHKTLEISYLLNSSTVSIKEENLNKSPSFYNDSVYSSNVNVSPLLKNNKYSQSKKLDQSNNSFILKRSKFSKIGLDVMNSNRVLMNFNKKNHLGMGYLQNHIRKVEHKKTKKYEKDSLIDNEASKVSEVVELNKSGLDQSRISVSKDYSDVNISSLSNSQNKKILKVNKSANNISLVRSRQKLPNENLKMNFMSKCRDNLDIDNCVNFMREMPSNDPSLINHIKLFETFLDIHFNVESLGMTGSSYLQNKKMTLPILLKKFFSILRDDYEMNMKQTSHTEFFIFDSINKLYLKSLKLQILVFSIFFLSLSHLVNDTNLKLNIKKLMGNLTQTVTNIFEHFIYGQVLLNYNDIFLKSLRSNFTEKYIKIHKSFKLNKVGKLSETAIILNKQLDNLMIVIKQYSVHFFKFSQLKPLHNLVFDMLRDLEKYTLLDVERIIFTNVLYCHLENKIKKNPPYKNIEENGNYYLPPVQSKFDYTLVLDLDETLIHSFCTPVGGGMFLVRPHALDLLKTLSHFYEIVIFTAGTKDYADDILDKLDPDGLYIHHRLYRNHTSTLGLNTIKDLGKLGRDLSKVLIIDNVQENFKLQPHNGLWIKTWDDDVNDIQLQQIIRILNDLYISRVSDVRTVVKKVKEEFNISKTYENINI